MSDYDQCQRCADASCTNLPLPSPLSVLSDGGIFLPPESLVRINDLRALRYVRLRRKHSVPQAPRQCVIELANKSAARQVSLSCGIERAVGISLTISYLSSVSSCSVAPTHNR